MNYELMLLNLILISEFWPLYEIGLSIKPSLTFLGGPTAAVYFKGLIASVEWASRVGICSISITAVAGDIIHWLLLETESLALAVPRKVKKE